jgi:hypothetical protein
MWISAVAVPIGLLAVPLWLAHLEERVIRSHGIPEVDGSGAPAAPDPDGVAEPLAPVLHPHRQVV